MGESAWGHAIATVARDGTPLSFYFPAPRLGAPDTAGNADLAVPDEQDDSVRAVRIARQLRVAADLDQPPTDSADAYLRLRRPQRRTSVRRRPGPAGAHLAEGTTVMHEGFINFNAGTLGPAMVEGRISQGVVVGAETDIGGGASIMGTLSGGGTQVISVGQRCLLGANSGLGISLGDDCVIEAGLYLTAGTIVTLPDGQRAKARDLSGQSGLLFRRNSITGSVEAITRPGKWGSLSTDLHARQ